MAAINDLLKQISDVTLRKRLEQEFSRLTKTKKFGLVFEEHIPECTPLYGVPVRCGLTVARKNERISDLFTVIDVTGGGGNALCRDNVSGETVNIPLTDVVVVAQFGEPIFPMLEPIDYVENAINSNLWHTLIEADNYHALQLLEYLYPKQVDCIYIDPPYNTGATDWKYNNDYVDSNDNWRHSKWLSMMKKRLLLAKNLLKETGVLVVTIDDNELSNLDCILLEMFPEYDRFIVTIEHSKRGRRGKNIAKSNEFALFFIKHGLDVICEETVIGLGGETRNLRRTGSGSLRAQRHKKFYPIYIDTNEQRIIEIGDYLPLEFEPSYNVPVEIQMQYPKNTLSVVWPFDEEGIQKNWHYAAKRARNELELGKLSIKEQKYGWQVYYQLRERDSKKYKTVWTGSHLDASTHGTELLTKILGRDQTFEYPKSLYAVLQCMYATVKNNRNALIVDFFAGSGTTLHAVNLMNTEDDGNRRCILVTNNEVSDEESKTLREDGFQPGDYEWEKYGICRAITWPRTKQSIIGKRIDGTPLMGEYITSQTAIKDKKRSFYQLSFMGSPFEMTYDMKKQIVSILRNKNGKPQFSQKLIKPDCGFIVSKEHSASILFDPSIVDEWLVALDDQDHITEFYIVSKEKSLFKSIESKVSELLGAISVATEIKRPMNDGIPANVEYFKLGFMDKNNVSLGRQFREIIPLLWLKSGAIGRRPKIDSDSEPEMLILPQNEFAILVDETKFVKFAETVFKEDRLKIIYFVTNSEEAFREMSSRVNVKHTYQLYRDYIDNFVLGSRRDLP